MRRSQKDILDSARVISRRGLVIGGLQLGACVVLGLRLRTMQLDRAEEYRLLSDGNSIKIRLLPPARGLILDRHGVELAGNEANYRVTLTREEAGDVEAVLDGLARLIPISPDERKALLDEIAKRTPSTPVAIRDRLSSPSTPRPCPGSRPNPASAGSIRAAPTSPMSSAMSGRCRITTCRR